MSIDLSTFGAASDELFQEAARCWQRAATQYGVSIEGFDPDAPLDHRIRWALQAGLELAAIYTRFSSKQQHSTIDQVRECLNWAAQNGVYVPTEFICVDEAVTGKKVRRDGLERMKQILQSRAATILLVYKASRLFRQAGKGFQLIQEEVVEEGLRAVSVSQGIDTDDKKSWKVQLQAHGLVDELLLDAIADHVRSGLAGLHHKGWTTGAIGVGYRRKELPDAPLTNRGLPRTVPEVDPDAAELIRKHARLHLEGMSLSEGLRRWRAAKGPCDPRSTTGRMNYPAYRRLWSNIRLTGRWEFGRKRNQFSTKRDYVRQVEQPDSEVATFQCEELRILDDETFLHLQKWLNARKQGPRGPRKKKEVKLWDLTTDLFFCADCSSRDGEPVRYYLTGANGDAMQCKNGDRCVCKSSVNREKAVRVLCQELMTLIARDAALIEEVVCRSQELAPAGDEDVRREIAEHERSRDRLRHQIDDLYELAGEGSDTDRREVQSKIRAARVERSGVELKLARLKKALAATSSMMTPDDVRRILSEVSTLLDDAASGQLGEEAVYRALAIVRRLTGGQVLVHVERRPARKRTNVRAVFRPQLIRAVSEDQAVPDSLPDEEVSVWLREPPRIDRLAQRVHELIDIQGLSHRAAAARLQEEDHKVNSGNVWYAYRRWYEMQGLPTPKLKYNNGHDRRSA